MSIQRDHGPNGHGAKNGASDDRHSLEIAANDARSRLMRTLAALDRRRHDLFDVGVQVHRHAGMVAAVGGALLIALGGGIALSAYRARSRRHHRAEERWRAIGRLWSHPELVARPQKPPLLLEIGRRLLVGGLTFAGMQLMKQGLRRALPAHRPPAALAGAAASFRLPPAQ